MRSSTPASDSLEQSLVETTWSDRRAAFPGRLWAAIKKYPFPAFCGLILLIIGLASGLAGVLPIADPNTLDPLNRLEGPSSAHWFGTDGLGRDVLSRLLWGGRLSLGIAVSSVAIAISVSTTIGLVSGYLGGRVDLVIQRLVDILMSIPGLIILITLILFLSEGGPQIDIKIVLIIGIALSLLGGPIRVSRAATLQVASLPYVEAAKTIGASTPRIIFRHIAPNIFAPMMVIGTAFLGIAILIEAGISFLGFGVQPPTPSWGDMLGNDARAAMLQQPLLSVWPGVTIFLVVFAFNIIGDAFRDAFDPRLRGSG